MIALRLLLLSSLLGGAMASSLRLPIAISLDRFVAQADASIPRHYESPWEILAPRALGQPVKVPLATRYFLDRGEIAVEGQGDRLILRLPLRYRVELGVPKVERNLDLGWKTMATSKQAEASILLETRITLEPDWRLTARTAPRIETLPNCRLTAFRERLQFDVTPQVRRAFDAGLAQAARELDRQVRERADLPRIAQIVWQRLHEPIPVTAAFAFELRPRSAKLAAPVFVRREIRTGLLLEGELAMRQPTSPPVPPLPALESTAPIEALDLDVLFAVPLEEANARLAESLRGQPFRTKGGRTVRLESIRFALAGERLVVEADVTGDFKGRLAFSGTPLFNAATGILSLEGFRYSLETENLLIRFANWLRQDTYRRQFEQLTRVSLPELLNEQKDRLEAVLKSSFDGGLRLAGRLDSVEFGRLAVDQNQLRIEGRAQGAVILDVQGW